ncbi:MAG: dihydroorotate dehydrogenase electron transfer subunit [Thermotaleaceae bacterium]
MKTSIDCIVLENQMLSEDIYRIILEKPIDMEKVHAGQFFHIQPAEGGDPFIRRPISICALEQDKLHLVIRKEGKGTQAICSKKPGDKLNLLGPLGNGFTVSNEKEKVIVVGGGIGTAPMLELTKNLQHKDVKVLLGYRKDPYLVEDFCKITPNVQVAVEEGPGDYRGFITDLLEKEIQKESADLIYACGPEIMLKKVQQIGFHFGIKTQLALEERMACGIGACLVCSCKVKAQENGWHFVRTCKEGPVFTGEEVIFDA